MIAGLIALAASASASAHVMLMPKEAPVGTSVRAAFHVGHGCSGSPTTRLRVQIPAGVEDVKAEAKPGFESSTVKGNDGSVEIVWTGLLPADKQDAFVMSFRLADTLEPDKILYFPAIQECQKGIARWIDKNDGSNPDEESDYPAPHLLLKPHS